jgi:predicted NBD/HSP70 family sugar kinase
VGEILAFDLGGTALRVGLFAREAGAPRRTARFESHAIRDSKDQPALLEQTLGTLGLQVKASSVAAVVLAVPGPVHGGVVDRLPTFLGAHLDQGLDFLALGRRVWPAAAISVCNDLTAAGYHFVDQGFEDFLVVNLGSGVGSKLFVGGRPMLGVRGHGGEIGHWRVPGAKPLRCECGGDGHLGALASGRGALGLAQSLAQEEPETFIASIAGALCQGRATALTTAILVSALHLDDAWTRGVLSIAAEGLGATLALCHLLTGTERFFIVGGFAVACGEPLQQMTWRAAQAASWPTGLDWRRAVTFADADTEHGLIGAGAMGRLILSGDLACG